MEHLINKIKYKIFLNSIKISTIDNKYSKRLTHSQFMDFLKECQKLKFKVNNNFIIGDFSFIDGLFYIRNSLKHKTKLRCDEYFKQLKLVRKNKKIELEEMCVYMCIDKNMECDAYLYLGKYYSTIFKETFNSFSIEEVYLFLPVSLYKSNRFLSKKEINRGVEERFYFLYVYGAENNFIESKFNCLYNYYGRLFVIGKNNFSYVNIPLIKLKHQPFYNKEKDKNYFIRKIKYYAKQKLNSILKCDYHESYHRSVWLRSISKCYNLNQDKNKVKDGLKLDLIGVFM